MAVDALAAAGQAPWAETLRQAKELGGVDIEACSLSMDLLHLDQADLDPLVDGVEGVTPSISTLAKASSSSSDRRPAEGAIRCQSIEISQTVDARGLSCPMPIVKTAQAIKAPAVGRGDRAARDGRRARSRTSRRGAGRPATSSSTRHRTARSTASSSAGSEAPAMTTETLAPFDPLADAIAAVDGWPETDEPVRGPADLPVAGDRWPRSRPATS